ncbi:hypothetical protein ATCC90586_009322 [Pythium insidiosum]|nr:hypothetical protein ATCC90586_009322 [Pythium insidiosum]
MKCHLIGGMLTHAFLCMILILCIVNASPHRKSIDFDALERAWEDGDDDRELRSPADDQFDRLNSASEEGARAMGPQMVFVTLDSTHEELESLANRWKELLWNGGIEANIYEIEKNKVLVGVQKGSAVPDLRRFLDEQQEVQEYEWNGQRFGKRRTKTSVKSKGKKKSDKKRKKADSRIHRTETTANEIPGSFNFSTNLIILHLLVHSLLQRLNNHIEDPNDCTWCDVANLHKNLMAQHLHVILVGEAQLQMSKQSCDVQLLGKYIKKRIQTRVRSLAQWKTIVHLVLEWTKVDDSLELNLSRLEKDRDYALADHTHKGLNQPKCFGNGFVPIATSTNEGNIDESIDMFREDVRVMRIEQETQVRHRLKLEI